MTASAAVTMILQTFAVISVFLLLGAFLRAKVKLFQRLYLPACVIGGFLALILGPNVLNLIKIPEDMMSAASALPNVLFIPIIAAMPVCSKGMDVTSLKKQKPVLALALILCFVGAMQFVIGLLVNVLCHTVGMETYQAFGVELAQGFIGSHGQVGATGSMLAALNQPYWETAAGINSTTATIGMIGGLLTGTFLINRAAKKGYTHEIKNMAMLPDEMRTGIYKKTDVLPDMGRQTTLSGNIETLSLHLGLLLLATGGGYVLAKQVSKIGLELLGAMATWIYALLVMAILWFVIRKCSIDHLFDPKVKNTITGLLSDYLITAAIMTIPVEMVMSYWVPILLMCVLGLIATPVAIYFLSKKYVGEYWFESCLGPLGCCHGNFVSGLLLIRMSDPEYKTPALNDYSLAYTLHNFYLIPFVPFIFTLTVNRGAGVGCLVSLGFAVVWLGLLAFLNGRKAKA